MRRSGALSTIASVVLCAAASACRPEPAVATPSGDLSVFAEAYPGRLGQVLHDFSALEQKARASLTPLRTPPAGLKDSERALAKALFERADRAGRSGYYADEAVRQEALDGLFEEGRAGLRRRVSGAVSYTVKQKKCGEADCSEELATELGNAAAYAADRALERQQEQHLDTHSEAAHYLDSHAAEFGARNLDALGKHSRSLARTSFIAYVRLELYRRELANLLDEESSASATLERGETEDRTALARTSLAKAQRTSIEHHLADTSAARAELAKEAPIAKQSQGEMATRIEALQKDYQVALTALLAALDQAAPTPAPSGSSPVATPVDRNANSTGAAR